MMQTISNYKKKHKKKLFCDAICDASLINYVLGITITNENLDHKNNILNLTNESEVA